MSRPLLHLDLEERRKIAKWGEAKVPVIEIASRLGRHRSTIFRDLMRNRFVDGELQHLSGYGAERRANRRSTGSGSAGRQLDVLNDTYQCVQAPRRLVAKFSP